MIKRTLYISLTISLLIILSVGSYLYIKYYHLPQSEIEIAENALADDELILISHFNNDLLTTIINYMVGKDDPFPIPIQKEYKGLWDTLYTGPANFRDNLDQLIFGWQLSIKGKNPDDVEFSPDDSNVAIIASGKFDSSILQELLAQYYDIESIDENNYKLTHITQEPKARVCPDDNGKKKTPITFYAHASTTLLVISQHKHKLSKIINRINSKSNASIDLTNWRNFRKDNITSLGILLPKQLHNTTSGFSKAIIQQTVNGNPDFISVFGGASIDYLGGKIKFDVDIFSPDQELIKKTEKETKTEIDKYITSAKGFSPTLAELSKVEISSEAGILHFSQKWDFKTLKKIPDIFGELISSIFSIGRNSDTGKENISEESINEDPWDYSINRKLSNLPPYRTKENDIAPVSVDGPFAIDIKRVGIGDKSNLLELELTTKILVPEIKGFWSNSQAKLTLNVDSVKSKDDKELLRDEFCIKKLKGFGKKNHESSEGLNSNNNSIYIDKTIRLIPEANFNNIDKITGKIQFTAPVNVKKIPVKLNIGSIVEESGLRFFITDIKQQSISYQITGEESKLLEIRALNSEGKTLQKSFSSRFSGKTVANFRGDVKGLEVYILAKEKSHEISFSLNADDILSAEHTHNKQPLPILTEPNIVDIEKWTKLKTSTLTLEEIKKRHTYWWSAETPKIAIYNKSPIIMFFEHDYNSTWKNSLSIKLLLPFIDELVKNLTAIEIQVFDSKSKPNPGIFKEFINLYPGQSIPSGKYIPDFIFKDTPYLKKKFDMLLGLEQGEKINALEGNLLIKLPQSIDKTITKLPDFGNPILIGENTIFLQEISRGFIPRIKINFEGNVDKLINIVAITKTGQRIFPAQQSLKDNAWIIQYDLRSDIKEIEVIIAKEQAIIKYPFQYEPNYN